MYTVNGRKKESKRKKNVNAKLDFVLGFAFFDDASDVNLKSRIGGQEIQHELL